MSALRIVALIEGMTDKVMKGRADGGRVAAAGGVEPAQRDQPGDPPGIEHEREVDLALPAALAQPGHIGGRAPRAAGL